MRFSLVTLLLLAMLACNKPASDAAPATKTGISFDDALTQITRDDLAAHIKVLASDEFEGRAPSSPGEEKTMNYLEQAFTKLGLKPGNGNSFKQEVPLIELTADANMRLTIQTPKQSHSLAYGKEMMAWTKRVEEHSEINASEMVFVGYGIVAPEYNWNDYEGLDVKGKTVVMLVNDPGYATRDEALFNGFAMTYYGRWTYKFEEAARQGAAGALIIHADGPAGYPWEVVSGSWSGPQFDLVTEDNNASRCAVEGWLTHDVAETLFAEAGQNLAELESAATKQGFRFVPLKSKATVAVHNKVRRSISNNFLALLPGEKHPDEYVIFTAHWDHLGKDPTMEGDGIYNGAIDNASGTAALIEIAQSFTMLADKPDRSLIFMAVTAEEQGLLGSRFYSENPVYPPGQTVTVINMDALAVLGETNDVEVVGFGNSELDNYIKEEAAKQNRIVVPDSSPEQGGFYRSDHISFAKVGVPAMYAESGLDMREGGEAAGKAEMDDYLHNDYHKPSDEYNDSWGLGAAIQDLRLFFRIGYRLSQSEDWPNWYEGNEFRAIRDASRAGK